MSIYFKMTAEPVRGAERTARWEYLEGDRWRELRFLQTAFDFRGSGFLRLAIPKLGLSSLDGVRWLRCKVPDEVRRADGTFGPARYPRVTHVLLNACEVANLQRRELEKFSAFGVPNQRVQLLFQPVVVLDRDVQNALPEDLHGETFIDVGLEEGEDVKSWTWSADDDLRDAERNSEVYAVDPVRGIVRFGDGVHGLIPKAGTHNVVVKHYFTTDGLAGNVPQGTIAVCPPFASQLVVDNPFPAVGGRNVEDVDDLVRRAPRALTGRARAVTTEDFELIAREASGTLARCHAYKDPADDPWVVRLVVLPQRDPKTHDIPDAEEIGLLAAVRDYVQHRCLINTVTKVEMTDLVPITVELTCRLQPRTNPSGVRARAEAWVTGFLDPYTGGVDAAGWPFGELPRAQDLQHIIKEIPEIRHVEQCQVLRAVREGEALSVTRHLDPRAVRPRQLFVLAATPSIVVEEG
jgi:predicted phage baseplate assembly protein